MIIFNFKFAATTDLIGAVDSLKSETLKPVDPVPLDLSQLLEQCTGVQAVENQPQQSTIPCTNSQTSRSPHATGAPFTTVTPLATVTSLLERPMTTSFDRYVSNYQVNVSIDMIDAY